MNARARVLAGRMLAVMAIAAVAVVVVNAQSNQRTFSAYHFVVEIDGQNVGFFKSVGGLSIESEVLEFRDGGVNGVTHKLPGNRKYPNIELSRPFTGDRALYEWTVAAQTEQPIKVDGRITMFDRHGNRIAAWKFKNGFPCKWEGPEYDATKNEVAIETIEIAHEGLVMADDGDDDDGR